MHKTMVLGMILLLLGGGCSKEEMKQALDDAKAKTQQVTKTAVAEIEERLPASGNIELRSNPKIEQASKATVRIISIGDGRPSSVEIASYNPSSEPTYPAIYLHGPTTAADAQALSGQTVACDLYLQVKSHLPVAMTRPGESAQVTFNRFDAEEGTVIATIAPVELMTSDDQTLSVSGGNIVAVAKPTEGLQ